MKNRISADRTAPLGEKLRLFRESGSKSHRKIAEYLLANYGRGAGMTVSELAGETGVSEATVVRFARALGFKGYPELQQAFQSAVKSRLTALERLEIVDARFGGTVLSATLQSEISSLKATLEEIDRKTFDEIVGLLLGARNIYIVATRSATALADYLNLYLSMILDNVRLVQFGNGSDLYEQILRIGSGDVLIGITFPRYSKRTVDAMSIAKQHGAITVALTDSETSPIAALSDKALYAKNPVTSFVDSLVAPMALINALVTELGRERKEATASNLAHLESLWEDYSVYNPEQK